MPTSRPTRTLRALTRRSLLNHLGASLVAAPLAPMLGCSDDAGGVGSDTGDTTDDTGTESETGDDCVPADDWALGGTAAMTATHCYPDPFAAGVMTCALLCETTAGPCTSDTLERQDVSEGFSGLPVRLALKFVDADACEPIEGALVEIWHTQRTGVYSGVTPGGDFCNLGDTEAESYLYFRGTQTTDAEGRVDFDTCYPGWYAGRAIHIHFRVVLDGQSHLVSQLFFTDELTAEIFASHPEYMEFGSPDTINTNDSVIGGETELAPYLLDTERMADGAMLAWKLIAIRSSPSDPSCEL